jgi:hypothetical protein
MRFIQGPVHLLERIITTTIIITIIFKPDKPTYPSRRNAQMLPKALVKPTGCELRPQPRVNP